MTRQNITNLVMFSTPTLATIHDSGTMSGWRCGPASKERAPLVVLVLPCYRSLTCGVAEPRDAERCFTADDSVLRTEMTNLESQEEDNPNRVLYFKPMSWLGQVRPHRRDEAWSASLSQTFFAESFVSQIPLLAEMPLLWLQQVSD